MHIALCGPLDTAAFRNLTGFNLQDAPNGLGGMPMTALAASLIDMGHKVSIATTDSTIETTLLVEEGGCQVLYCPLRAAPRYKARVRAMDMFEREIAQLSRAIRGFDADIVHAHWTYEFAEAAVRSGLPHVVTMHDLGWDYLGIYRDSYRAMRLLMKYRVMPRVRNLTVVAPFMAKKAWQYGYFGHVDVVPNGLTVPGPVKPGASRGPDWGPRIFTIGNPGPIKNVRASVEAFRRARRLFPTAELHLFGPGLDDSFVSGAPGVFGHGNVDHRKLMARLEAEATLLVHPSRLECCPMIVAEAKARGVPVVGGKNAGGVAFVCGDAGAITTDIENPDAIAKAVIMLLASPEKLEQERHRAREDAEARFDTDKVTRMYADVYDRILAGEPGRRAP